MTLTSLVREAEYPQRSGQIVECIVVDVEHSGHRLAGSSQRENDQGDRTSVTIRSADP